jgi:DNA repair exonuclease SbcCD ATPase subunit
MERRHADVNVASQQIQTVELEKELERIKERLRITESDLMIERNARLGGGSSVANHYHSTSPPTHANSSDSGKNREIRRLREELERNREAIKQIDELNAKNHKFESTIKDLQERLGKQSNVGWMKDDIDLEKDTVLNQLKEIEKLKETVSYE